MRPRHGDRDGEKLFLGPYATARGGLARANYDVFPDGSFLMLKPAPQHGPLTQINVVLGWAEEVKRLTSHSPLK